MIQTYYKYTKHYKGTDIYYIGYITIKKLWKWLWKYLQCKSFVSDNCYSRWTYWRKNGSKYLVFDSTDENKEVLKKYTELSNGIENETKTINGGKKGDYGKVFMKIKLDTDDNLPLNKQLKLHMLTIIVRSVFEEDGKLYPEVFLDGVLYECMYKC